MSKTRIPLERVQDAREVRTSSRRKLLGAAAGSALVFSGVRLPKAQPAGAQLAANMDRTFRFRRRITFRDLEPSVPYNDAFIDVTGMRGSLLDITVRLLGLSHQNLSDLNVLLVAPNGDAIMLVSDVGDGANVSGLQLTFDTTSATLLPAVGQVQSGTYAATNYDTSNDEMPPQAPLPNITAMSQLTGTPASQLNGRWFLYCYDRSLGFGGSLREWTLNLLTTNSRPRARNDSYEVEPGELLRVRRPGVLRNDRDVDDDKLEVIPFTKNSSIGRIRVRRNGSLTFRAKKDARGRARFKYTITDGNEQDSATITINVKR